MKEQHLLEGLLKDLRIEAEVHVSLHCGSYVCTYVYVEENNVLYVCIYRTIIEENNVLHPTPPHPHIQHTSLPL